MGDMSDISINSRVLVVDYVNDQLQRRNFTWPNRPNRSPSPGRVERAMRALCEEFEARYTEVFQEMCQRLDVTPDNAQQTFKTTVAELFKDGIKWGRVVALFAFAGSLAVECMEKNMPLLVDQVVDLTVNYIDTHLRVWIQQHGGWDGFVDFYEGRPEQHDDSSWPLLSTLCGCAVGAIGILTLGAFFSQKS